MSYRKHTLVFNKSKTIPFTNAAPTKHAYFADAPPLNVFKLNTDVDVLEDGVYGLVEVQIRW